MTGTTPLLVLASASRTRADLLKRAGVAFVQDPAEVDESVIKADYKRRGKTAAQAAQALALAKAKDVAKRRPSEIVLGADQILCCDGNWFDKPADMTLAKAQLYGLRGRSHTLETAACIVQGTKVLWEHHETPTLTVRPFGSPFIEAYLRQEGKRVLGSVGAYRLEGPGLQLFSRVEGDHFTIQGLPLMALLQFLRWQGLIDD